MTFYEWLLWQKTRNDPIGDVARDAERDLEFPKYAIGHLSPSDFLEKLLTHLMVMGACQGANDAVTDALVEYMQFRMRVFHRNRYHCQICGTKVVDVTGMEIVSICTISKPQQIKSTKFQTVCFSCFERVQKSSE